MTNIDEALHGWLMNSTLYSLRSAHSGDLRQDDEHLDLTIDCFADSIIKKLPALNQCGKRHGWAKMRIFHVIRRDGVGGDFLDDRNEVAQRANGLKWRQGGISK